VKLLLVTEAQVVLHGRSQKKLDSLLCELPGKKRVRRCCFDLAELERIAGFIAMVEWNHGKVTHLSTALD